MHNMEAAAQQRVNLAFFSSPVRAEIGRLHMRGQSRAPDKNAQTY